MKEDDAKKVLEIMSSADGGCEFCVKSLFDKFIKVFGFKALVFRLYKKKFGKGFKEELCG